MNKWMSLISILHEEVLIKQTGTVMMRRYVAVVWDNENKGHVKQMA